jgi:nicotinamide mononucleotide adenylyltransferase
MEYLLAGKAKCDFLYIGITNPHPALAKYTPADPHRSSTLANPMNYWERERMIVASMLEAGIPREKFTVVPFPINFPEYIFHYAPKEAIHFVTIYDEWGYEKKAKLERLGCEVDVMWTRSDTDRVARGHQVRDLIANNEPWKHLVPKSVYDYIINSGIDSRIRQIRKIERN